MTKEVIKSASTIEEAKAAAMLELGLTEDDDFHYEVIKMPTKKILGLFGGSPAEVKVSVEVPDAPAKKEKAKKEQKPAPKAEKSAPKKENQPKADKSAEAKTAEKPDFKPSDAHEETARYIVSVVKGLGLADCKIQAYEAEDEVLFELDCGEDYGIVIGRRGETLDAIQQLTNYSINRGGESKRARVQIDAENYREKREESLERLAQKVAGKVVKYRRNVTLEPMNAYERHVIHTALQDTQYITTFSIGTEPNRRVVVSYDRTKQ